MNLHAYTNFVKQPKNDEWITPSYGILPLLEFLPINKMIWCPFDTEQSNYVKLLRARGYQVVCSHINNNQDFFNYEPTAWDIIVSNPPFSKKDAVLKRCYQLGKPFALLLPISSLQSAFRGKLFNDYGIQLLAFDKRIHFNNMKAVYFGSAYFCWGVLPSKFEYRILSRNNQDQTELAI